MVAMNNKRISGGTKNECNRRSLRDDKQKNRQRRLQIPGLQAKGQATAKTSATADPYGMTSKRTGNGKSNGDCNRDINCEYGATTD
jgi:hypothetical protein